MITITITPLLVSGIVILTAFVVGVAAGIGLCLWMARDVEVQHPEVQPVRLRKLAVVLFLLGLLRVLWAEGTAHGQSWRTPTPTWTPRRSPTPRPATPTPVPPIATSTPRPSPGPTGTPVTIGDADGYAGITLAACAIAFPHRAFDSRTAQVSVRWSEAEQWRPVRNPWEGGAFVFADGRPLTLGAGRVQTQWKDGVRTDTRWFGVVIGAVPNPTVTPRWSGTTLALR